MPEKTLQAIKFDKEKLSLEILDQLLLPYTTSYISIKTIQDAYDAIKTMKVRGAPAIAIVGAFAIVVDTKNYLETTQVSDKTIEQLTSDIDYLVTSRPTAVNLSNACNDIKTILSDSFKQEDLIDKKVLQKICNYAVALYEDDLNNNFKIGDNGVKYIAESLEKQNFKGAFSIITICNTGSLATSGHGTALGIIRSVHQQLSKEAGNEFWLDHVYPLETRPYNQGAKLTTYELNYEKIPFTLICDNMVSSLISSLNKEKSIKQSTAPVKFVIVGADRIVENGDTANKIGTFQLSTIAHYFNTSVFKDESQKIKFIVAAPRTTIDLKTKVGDGIVIEERPAHELTTLTGPVLNDQVAGDKLTVGIATPGISVWNPAFDVTSHELIDSIVTEEYPAHTKDEAGNFHLHK